MVKEWFSAKFLVLELNNHKNILYNVTMAPCVGMIAEKNYRPAQLNENRYCISKC